MRVAVVTGGMGGLGESIRSCTHKLGSPDWGAFDVRLSPNSGAKADIQPLRLSATTGLMHRSKEHCYSITSSAWASSIWCAVSRVVK
jgi:hypothetical protein